MAAAVAAHAQLRGHGGPVRALAISQDGKSAISGSFDTSAIRWSLEKGAAAEVLRFHDGAVNAVALLRDGRAARQRPDAQGRIVTRSHHRFAVGRERDTIHVVLVTFEHARLTNAERPQPRGVIP